MALAVLHRDLVCSLGVVSVDGLLHLQGALLLLIGVVKVTNFIDYVFRTGLPGQSPLPLSAFSRFRSCIDFK